MTDPRTAPEQPFDDFDTQIQAEEVYPDEPWDEDDGPEDHFRDDVEADADALASAGWGSDEDYGSAADML